MFIKDAKFAHLYTSLVLAHEDVEFPVLEKRWLRQPTAAEFEGMVWQVMLNAFEGDAEKMLHAMRLRHVKTTELIPKTRPNYTVQVSSSFIDFVLKIHRYPSHATASLLRVRRQDVHFPSNGLGQALETLYYRIGESLDPEPLIIARMDGDGRYRFRGMWTSPFDGQSMTQYYDRIEPPTIERVMEYILQHEAERIATLDEEARRQALETLAPDGLIVDDEPGQPVALVAFRMAAVRVPYKGRRLLLTCNWDQLTDNLRQTAALLNARYWCETDT